MIHIGPAREDGFFKTEEPGFIVKSQQFFTACRPRWSSVDLLRKRAVFKGFLNGLQTFRNFRMFAAAGVMPAEGWVCNEDKRRTTAHTGSPQETG